MTPTRLGLPFGYGSERGEQGKGEVINVGAGSTNWSVRQGGPLAGGEKLVQGEGPQPLPQASARGWRARHSRSWKKNTTVLMAGSIIAITPPVSSSPLSR